MNIQTEPVASLTSIALAPKHNPLHIMRAVYAKRLAEAQMAILASDADVIAHTKLWEDYGKKLSEGGEKKGMYTHCQGAIAVAKGNKVGHEYIRDETIKLIESLEEKLAAVRAVTLDTLDGEEPPVPTDKYEDTVAAWKAAIQVVRKEQEGVEWTHYLAPYIVKVFMCQEPGAYVAKSAPQLVEELKKLFGLTASLEAVRDALVGTPKLFYVESNTMSGFQYWQLCREGPEAAS